mgnify:CR=1 FL=1
METSALILMTSTWFVVTGFTVYFFWKVLTSKNQAEPDSYLENDDQES